MYVYQPHPQEQKQKTRYTLSYMQMQIMFVNFNTTIYVFVFLPLKLLSLSKIVQNYEGENEINIIDDLTVAGKLIYQEPVLKGVYNESGILLSHGSHE
jgi:hypothetical protein